MSAGTRHFIRHYGVLPGAEHAAMLAGMLVVMLARRDESAHHAHVAVAS